MDSDKLYIIGALALNFLLFLLVLFLCWFFIKKEKGKRKITWSILKKALLITPVGYVFIIIVSFIAMLFTADTVQENRAIERMLNSENLAVIVLGNPAKSNGQPSKILKSRLDKALEISKKPNVVTTIVSGSSVYNQFVEAEVMQQYLILHGVNNTKIIPEKRARNTFQNAQFSMAILRDLGIKNTVVVTSDYHKRRAKKLFSKITNQFVVVAPEITFKTFLKYFPFYVSEVVATLKIKNNEK